MDANSLVKGIAVLVYEARRQRRENPEGTFDRGGRWYPSAREDAEGDGSCVRQPSKAWPYSYMLRCRTRQHCTVLAQRAVDGHDVPEDVKQAVCALAQLVDGTQYGICRDWLLERHGVAV